MHKGCRLESPPATGTAESGAEALRGGVYATVQWRSSMRRPKVAAALGSTKVATTSLVRATPASRPSGVAAPAYSV